MDAVDSIRFLNLPIDQRMDDLAVLLKRIVKPGSIGQREHAELLIHRAHTRICCVDQAIVTQGNNRIMQLFIRAGVLLHIILRMGFLHHFQNIEQLLLPLRGHAFLAS